MAYAAMNEGNVLAEFKIRFLNGVCRHEQPQGLPDFDAQFLNGVCRHEP